MEALGVVDAVFFEDVEGGLVFDAFGDGELAEAFGEADDGVHDVPVGGAVGEASDELNVDFEVA